MRLHFVFSKWGQQIGLNGAMIFSVPGINAGFLKAKSNLFENQNRMNRMGLCLSHCLYAIASQPSFIALFAQGHPPHVPPLTKSGGPS